MTRRGASDNRIMAMAQGLAAGECECGRRGRSCGWEGGWRWAARVALDDHDIGGDDVTNASSGHICKCDNGWVISPRNV